MPAKFHIHTRLTPPRIRPEGKLGIVDWREDCSSCKNCVKKGCVYGLYRDEADALRDEKSAISIILPVQRLPHCVQNCHKNILTRVVNPEYERLGDAYYTPDIVLTTWFQAEPAAFPCPAAATADRFRGEGFDSMWTDMSEIVRPTRDGIHGREYINTGVDIGRKRGRHFFDNGKLARNPPPRLTSPLPLMFDNIEERWAHPPVVSGACECRNRTGRVCTGFSGQGSAKLGTGATGQLVAFDYRRRHRFWRAVRAGGHDNDRRFPTALSRQLPHVKRKNAGRIVAVRLSAK